MKVLILSVIFSLFILSIPSLAFADHNEATKDYPRSEPEKPINNNPNAPIQVKYLDWVPTIPDRITELLDGSKTWESFKFAYGEEEENVEQTPLPYIEAKTVQVPFEVSGFFCNADTSGFVPVMTCVFRGYAPDGSLAVWDHVEEKWTTKDTLEQEAKEIYKEEMAERAEQEKTYWEKVADAIGDDPRRNVDAALLKKINNMIGALCYQGVGTTSGVQNIRTFDIPTKYVPIMKQDTETGEWYDTGRTQQVLDYTDDISNLDLKGIYGKVQKAVDECRAQNILLNDQGGVLSSHDTVVGYLDQLGNPTHQEMALTKETYSQERINSMMNANGGFNSIEEFLQNEFCSEDAQYTVQWKKSMGCDMGYEMTGPVSTDGQIEYDNPVEKAFNQYMSGDESDQLKKLKERVQAEFNRKMQKIGGLQ